MFDSSGGNGGVQPAVDVKSLHAMCGRLGVGKDNLHVAALVGAAMCSACWDNVQNLSHFQD